MKRDKPDLSRLVTLDLSPTEAAMLERLLVGILREREADWGIPLVELLDGTIRHIRLQLRQLHWPEGHKAAPYPV